LLFFDNGRNVLNERILVSAF